MSYSEEEYIKNTRQSFAAGRVVGLDEGIQQERQRIIELLEGNYWHLIYFAPQEGYATKPLSELKTVHAEGCIGCQAIALIRGEK